MVETAAEAAALAVENGCELNCGTVYLALTEAVELGLISEETINRAVKRLFLARFRLGMFDPPDEVPYAQIPYEIIDSPGHQALALQAARQSIVLLKNEGEFLPLRKDISSIAVIGPNADDLAVLLGNYSGTPRTAVTPLEGIRRKVSTQTKVYYAQGCEIAAGVPPMQVITSTYLRATDSATFTNGLKGEYYLAQSIDGGPVMSRVDPEINFTWKDTNPLTGEWGDTFSAKWEGYLVPPKSGLYRLGVNGYSDYRLYLEGSVIAENSVIHHPIFVSQEIELEAGRFYKIELDYANRGLDPQIQLLWSLPGIDHESSALEAAKKADVIVMVMGLSPRLEGEEMPVNVEGFAGGDRTDIRLPDTQERLLKKIHALGKPVILLLMNGSAVAINWAAENIPAIVEAWYPGQAGGEAIAGVLFGDYNPSGKLPISFYKSVGDLPPFDDYELEGHTYRYFAGELLYPFGHGLSYTNFHFDELQVDWPQVEVGGVVKVSLQVTNTGQCAGYEVVQLYVRQRDPFVSRLVKKLMGFSRLHLQPGERKSVTFTVHSSQLGSFEDGARYVVRPGPVEVLVGNSSDHLPLSATVEVVGQAADMSTNRVFFSEVSLAS